MAVMESKGSAEAKKVIEREVHGDGIVRFVGIVLDAKTVCHVTELVDLGTLIKVLAENAVGAEMKLKMMWDVAKGIKTLRSFNVIHRDLKAGNVLCKITDFGISRPAESVFAMAMTRGQGTPLFMAPEIPGGQKRYSKAVDVYSYGILCSVIWNNGEMPSSESNFQTVLALQNEIVQGTRPSTQNVPPQLER